MGIGKEFFPVRPATPPRKAGGIKAGEMCWNRSQQCWEGRAATEPRPGPGVGDKALGTFWNQFSNTVRRQR